MCSALRKAAARVISGVVVTGAVLLVTAAAAMAAAPSVYVASGTSAIDQFTIGSTGALSPKTPPSATAYANQLGLAVSPDGRNLYATSNSGDEILQYSIGADATLTPKSPASVSLCCSPNGIVVSPDGKSVYAVTGQGVSEYDVGADGTLTAKSTPSIAAGLSPYEIAISPDGESVYVTNDGDNTNGNSVSQYDVGANGILTVKSPATVAAGLSPYGIVVSPDGGSVYVADSSAQTGTVAQFDVGADGKLSAKTTAFVSTGASSQPHGIAISPDGTHVYTADFGSGYVSAFNVGAGGALTAANGASAAANGEATGIAVSADGDYLYVTNQDDTTSTTNSSISQYGIGSDGTLTAQTPATVPTGSGSSAIVAVSGTQLSGTAGAPSATVSSPPDGASYTLGQAATAHYACIAGSPGGALKGGSAGCSGPVADGASIDTASVGPHSFSVTATDTDGQTGTVTTHYTVTAASSGDGSGGSGLGGGGSGGGGSGGAQTVSLVSSIQPVGNLVGGQVDTVSVQAASDVDKLQWSLAGAAKPSVTCAGQQTELSFKATTAASETVSVTGVTSTGVSSSTQLTLTLGKAPAIVASTPAAHAIEKILTPVVAKSPAVYDCSPAAGHSSVDFSSPITRHICLSPSTIHVAHVEISGCVQKLSALTQVSAGEDAILTRMAPDAYRAPFQKALGEPGGLSMFELLAGAYYSYGLTRVNGVDFAPNGSSSIVILPVVRQFGGSNVDMSVGKIELKLPQPDVMLSFGAIIGNQIPLGTFARDPIAGALTSLGDFGLVGDVTVSLVPDTGTSDITAHVELPYFMTQGGVRAQAAVNLTANTTDGLVTDGFTVGPFDGDLAGFGVQDLNLRYSQADGQWSGNAKACLFGDACLGMDLPNGGVVIRNGQLVKAAMSSDYPYPGVPLFTGLSLTHIGVGFGLNPDRLYGSAGLLAAGFVGLNGNAVFAFPSPDDPYTLTPGEAGTDFPSDFYSRQYTGTTVAVSADVSLDLPIVGSYKLANGYFLFEAPGYAGFGGSVNEDFDGILSLSGGVDGEVNDANARYNTGGHVKLCIADVICGGAAANLSDNGVGGCVTVGPFNIGGGFEYHPFEVKLWPFDGCKWSRFADTNVFGGNVRGRTADAPIDIRIKPGDRSRAIELDGAASAPSVDVTGPGGVHLDSPAGAGVEFGKGVRIIRSLTLKKTVIGLVDPKPGSYSLTLDPGSAPVTQMSEATDPPDAKIHVRLHGTGATRKLSYVIGHRPDQQVTFLEVRGAVSRQIATVKNDRGTVRFTPTPGRGRQTIVAQFQLAGLSAERLTVARFASPSPLLSRVRSLHAKRHGGTLSVSWRPVSGAAHYNLVLRASEGGQRLVSTRRTKVALRGVDSASGGVVLVNASAPQRAGRPTSARYVATTALRTPAISALHPKVAKRKRK